MHLGIRAAVEDGSGKVLDTIKAQKWTITSTMIDFPQEDYSTLDTIKVTGGVVPDEAWEQNRKLFLGAAQATAKLGVKFLSMHAGFIDESNKAVAEKMHDPDPDPGGHRPGQRPDAAARNRPGSGPGAAALPREAQSRRRSASTSIRPT